MAADQSYAAATAANRFGLGIRPGENAVLNDPALWLAAQLRAAPDGARTFDGLPTSFDYMQREVEFYRRRNQRKGAAGVKKGAAEPSQVNALRESYQEAFGADLRREYLARWTIAADTGTPFAERLVRFWSNHFAVSTDKLRARLYALPMEREAIRPHVNGRFFDLLLAVQTHPAMLRYLDQGQSIGPDSRAARRVAERADGAPARKRGLNENLAREILELHTLGADSGYTQADVTEFARALTGWSMPVVAPQRLDPGAASGGAFLYREAAHEPGVRTILGQRYSDDGQDQARAILADLAVHPATARHLAGQLARHFIADQPPPPVVQRMAQAYLDSHGELTAMYQALIHSLEAWAPQGRKFRTPQDFIIAGIRGGDVAVGTNPRLWEGLLMRLGQPTFQPHSPAGFTDVASDWIAPDAIWKRVQVAQALGERVPRTDLDALARATAVLGPHLDAPTRQAIARAEAPGQAMATLFACPAFQWRI